MLLFFCLFVLLSVHYLLPPPPSFLLPPSLSLTHPIIVIAIWIFVFWLIWCGAYRSSMCCSHCLLHLSHPLYQHAVFWCRGERKKLHFILNSCHLTLLFQKQRAEKIMFKRCRRSSTCRCRLCNPTSTQMVILPKHLWSRETCYCWIQTRFFLSNAE